MRKLQNHELDRLSIAAFKKADKLPVILVLDNIRSLNNIGSVFRTADAFRIEKIILCGITATPPHKDIRKTALGATESVDWDYQKSTLEAVKTLQGAGICAVAVEQAENAMMLQSFTPERDRKLAFVFGNEVKGVGQDDASACDQAVETPQNGTKHSLNISVSVRMVVWDVWVKSQ